MLALGGVRRRAWPVAVALSVLVLPALAAPVTAELLAQRGRVVTEPEPADPRAAPPPSRQPPPTVNTPPPPPSQPRQPGKVVTEPEPAGPGGGPSSPAPPWAPPPQPPSQPRPTPANDPNPRPDVNPPASEACRRFPNLC